MKELLNRSPSPMIQHPVTRITSSGRTRHFSCFLKILFIVACNFHSISKRTLYTIYVWLTDIRDFNVSRTRTVNPCNAFNLISIDTYIKIICHTEVPIRIHWSEVGYSDTTHALCQKLYIHKKAKRTWKVIRPIWESDYHYYSRYIQTNIFFWFEFSLDIFRNIPWCPWCNGYRRRKWIRRHEFKSWTRLIAFHIALIHLGKVWIQLFSLQLWVNSRTHWVL